MKELNKKELSNIVGGAISGTFISSIVKSVQVILDLGRSFGSALRRLFTKQYC